ncbi:hypothetical protein [Pseudoalteromonas piscicida]|uniref:hypothetical protein n=1 Tax=Pseudoalteromonas piscicida TaxID=43662 RepID=UPI0005FA5E6F|nr:hypothetical protein [Pseudoalteromonas piscicida]KJZ05159.1 hypothetical protein TW73_01095 [Pseudoalteromonas piscicida]
MELKDLDEHCGELSNLIVQGTEYFIDREEWQQPLTNLKVASGLRSIDYDTSRFDHTLGWCGPADTFSDHQHVLEQKLVTELCRFHFIWSALEATIDISVPIKSIKNIRGKISKTCFYIKSKNGLHPKFDAYILELARLEKILTLDSFYSEIFESIEIPEHINLYGKGIFLAYKLRNLLAHGSLELPITQQEDECHYDSDIVKTLSRLTLYTIQVLAIIDLQEDFPWFSWHYVDVPIEFALTNIQFDVHPEDIYEDPEPDIEDKNQLKLDFTET